VAVENKRDDEKVGDPAPLERETQKVLVLLGPCEGKLVEGHPGGRVEEKHLMGIEGVTWRGAIFI